MVVRNYEILNRNINSKKELWDTAKESETYKAEIMALYRLIVIHWSIFTLSTQLILCASIYSSKWIFLLKATINFIGFQKRLSLVSWENSTKSSLKMNGKSWTRSLLSAVEKRHETEERKFQWVFDDGKES